MLRDSANYALVRLVNGLLSIAAVFVLSRVLTSEEYGRYALATAIAAFVASAGFQWINVSVSRFHPKFRDDEGLIVREALTLYLRVAILIALLMGAYALGAPAVIEFPLSLIALIGLGSLGLAAHALGLQFANARQSPSLYASITFSRGAIGLALAWVLVSAGYSWEGAVAGFLFAAVFSILFLAWALRGVTLRPNLSLRKDMMSYGLPLSLTYISTMVLDLSGRFVIGFFKGEGEVAGYAIGQDLVQQVFGAIMNAVFLAAFPSIVRDYEARGAEGARAGMQRLADVFAISAPLILGVFIGLSSEIATVIVGESVRAQVAQVMPWLAVAVLVGCIKSFYLDVVFQLQKKTGYQLITTAAMAVANLVLMLLLIESHGINGVAMAAAIAFAMGAVMSYRFGYSAGLYAVRPACFVKGAVATAVVAFAGSLSAGFSNGQPWISLCIGLATAFVVFVVVALVLDLGDCRKMLSSRFPKRS